MSQTIGLRELFLTCVPNNQPWETASDPDLKVNEMHDANALTSHRELIMICTPVCPVTLNKMSPYPTFKVI